MNRIVVTAAVMLAIVVLAGCSIAPDTRGGRLDLQDRATETMRSFKIEDPSIQRFFDSSVGHAVFPTVGKGGAGIGGAYGKGVVYEDDAVIGFCDVSQGTVGLQFGGQAYSEIIFFEHQGSLRTFKMGGYALSAQASAIALTAKASANVDYDHGVAVFTLGKGGLMLEASIGGQRFRYDEQ